MLLNADGTALDNGGTDPNPTPPDPTVYAPIPDVSNLETRKGGLLLSQGTQRNLPHTAYVMERGGKSRIGQFLAATQITWDRRRDDISEARLEFDTASAVRNATLLEKLAVGRHELKIFRGQEAVWEGPITLVKRARGLVTVEAKDVMWYANRTVMHQGYSNAYPNIIFAVERVAGILVAELGRKEALDPPINVLPYLHTYIEEGDARTTRATKPFESQVWEHIDDLAAKAGIDYTVVGRAIHFWDTSRAALGRTRALTEADFIGDAAITEYGVELATHYWVTDGNGHAGVAGAMDDFYGEVELLSTAYGETGNSVDDPNSPDNNQTVPQEELDSQAERGLRGRNPIPTGLHVEDNAQLDVGRGGLGFDVLVPGVYVPIRASLAGKTISQMQKLQTIQVQATSSGEVITVSLYPASDDDLLDEGLTADQVDAAVP